MRQAPKNSISGHQTKVSIITVNYKKPHHVRNLLKSIEAIELEMPFEFLLVDNASGDGSATMIEEQFPWVRLLPLEENIGFGPGNNEGMSRAQGEYLFICNPDLVLDRGEVEKWIDWMDRHPDIGISGPRLLNPDGTDQDSYYRFPKVYTPILRRTPLGKMKWAKRENHRYTMREHPRTESTDVDWVLGAAMMIRKNVAVELDFFDPNIFLYFEDTDLCRRAWEAGHRVAYTPDAKCMHYHARESVTSWPWQAITNRMTRLHIKSAVQYFWKHRGKPLPR